MASPLLPESTALPVRRTYDPDAGRLVIHLDVMPATADDLSLRVGPSRIHVRLDRPDGGRYERSFEPPTDRVFTDDRRAVYHNGVVEITLGLE
ncbi:Hsp20/alpha crystallin family protein [Salinilacihabitans rarus]|uniref:Hsp20/alpha crystallin family protein n=1 Tax=Salinilacihabitans rarus TaxID=2961596 RepID=UPI0020C8B2DE|nr:Hsp20/alpha crystallin family protein [Salinilacihabitans rarus]